MIIKDIACFTKISNKHFSTVKKMISDLKKKAFRYPGKTIVGLPYLKSTDLSWVADHKNTTPLDRSNPVFDAIVANYNENTKKLSLKAYDWTVST